ncbi:hypothetical protein JL722_4771 [Aureococcus anophagefferens]|nr:hypothetical protein JL722_4771 [Aureococcus anophagefferens]
MRARFLVLAGLRAASPCFDVVLLDSFGDGWQGAAVVVTRAKDALSPPLLVGQLASGYSETVELCLADGCYDVAVGDDLYASEVSVVVDGRATAGAPANASFAVEAGRVGAWGSCATRAPTLTAAPSASARPTAAPSHPCAEIVLRDSYGDGWQGAALAISRGAVTVFTGALASGDEAVDVACLDDGCYAAALGNDTYPSEVSATVGGHALAGASAAADFLVAAGVVVAWGTCDTPAPTATASPSAAPTAGPTAPPTTAGPSVAPTSRPTAAPSLTAAPTATRAPTKTPWWHHWITSATPFCRLGDASLCAGNHHFLVEVTQHGPFEAVPANWTAPALADLDGDGDVDLVAAGAADAAYWENDPDARGTPAFAAAADNPFADVATSEWSSLVLGDVDGDGDLDLLVNGDVDGDGYVFGIRYWENVGSSRSPAFAEADDNPFAGVDIAFFSRPALADLDGDADLDLVVVHDADDDGLGELYYYEHVGKTRRPAYELRAASPVAGIALDSYYGELDFGDVDGDGDLDLALGDRAGALRFFDNQGSSAAADLVEMTGAASPVHGVDTVGWSSPTWVDLDGDGDLDLAVHARGGAEHDYAAALRYFDDLSSAARARFTLLADTADPFAGVAAGSFSMPAFGDTDGDGDLDLVLGERLGSPVGWGNVGSPTAPDFSVSDKARPVYMGAGQALAFAPALGDVDGDGDLDLVLGAASGGLYLLRNVGGASGAAFTTVKAEYDPFDGLAVGGYSMPALGDVDGDGDLDAFVGAADGSVAYWENAGTRHAPAYEARAGLANPLRALDVGAYAAPALGDLDGDGDLDLVVGAEDGSFWFFYSDGAAPPSFQYVNANVFFAGAEALGANLDYAAPALADVDGDGDVDLVVGGEGGDLHLYANGFCTKEADDCSGNGFCDATHRPYYGAVCRCLSGFTGAHGRSRGACDEGFAGTGACACVEPFHGANCTLGECPSGTFEDDAQSADGLFRAAACVGCDQGRYSNEADGRPLICLPCAEPSTTIGASSTSCDACVAGHYMSRDGDCEYCDEDGHVCDVAGITVATLVVRRGHWRGSAATTTTYACPRSKNCKGGAAAGDDLCRGDSKGVLCNACRAGHYRVASGGQRGNPRRARARRAAPRAPRARRERREGTWRSLLPASWRSWGSKRIKPYDADRKKRPSDDAARAVVDAAALAVAEAAQAQQQWVRDTMEAAGGQAATLAKALRVEQLYLPSEHRRWYRETAKTLWLAGQVAVLFLKLEKVDIPRPFSWVVAGLEFVTLEPLTSLFFSPCAIFDHYTSVTLTTLVPVLFGVVAAAAAVGVFLFNPESDWRAVRRRCGKNYVTALLLFHPMVCIHIIGHFHCDGPFVVAGGRRRHVLASDYAVSCDGAIWHLYAAYAGLMLAAFVIFVPNAPALRVALCLFGVSAYLWFTAAFRPVARASSHVVESLAYAMLWFLALYATVSETRAGDSVKGACSAALFVFVVAVCGLTRHIKSNEGDFKLGDAILRREPFAAAKFEAATSRSSKLLYDCVSRAASEVVDAPDPAGMAYLRTHLVALGSVWEDRVAAAEACRARRDALEAQLARLGGAPGPPEAQLARLFGDAAPVAVSTRRRRSMEDLRVHARARRTGAGSPEAAALGFGDVLELVAETTWSRFEVLRLDALWAMNGTSEVMARRCASFLAAEPWGSDLRGLANVEAPAAQPPLERPDLRAALDGLATARERDAHRAALDRGCLAELLRALAAASYGDFEAHLRRLVPGARTYGEDTGAEPGSPLAAIAEACEGGGGDWPHCARVTGARASVLCDDAEAFWHCFLAIRGDPADEAQTLRVVRLRNKLGAGKTPFNLHVNGLFRPSALADPILVEIQIWATPIMALNDVSHAQYEVVRAGAPGDI